MKEKKILQSFVMISQIGISMMVPIFLCVAIGRWLNQQFHNELLFIGFLLLGIGASFRSFYLITKSFYEKAMKEEHERMMQIEELKAYHEKHPEEDFSYVMNGKKKRYSDPKGPTRH